MGTRVWGFTVVAVGGCACHGQQGGPGLIGREPTGLGLVGPGAAAAGPAASMMAGARHAQQGPYGDNPGGPTLVWVRQLGTFWADVGLGIAMDGSDNAYIGGLTYGSLGGPNAGFEDAFLAKYDASGSLRWKTQLGTPQGDQASGVAVDGSGNAYIGGYTYGSLGGPNAGFEDAFLAKYDASGSLLWTAQLGASFGDRGWGVAVDGSGNAWITGSTQGSLGAPIDAFLAKYDASGSLLWTAQLGTSTYDGGRGVAVDGSGNAWITGNTFGSLGGPSAGSSDAFLAQYDASGLLLWTAQLGTSERDHGYGVAVDGSGNAWITGITSGSLGGPNAGFEDAFLAQYDASGGLLWTSQMGTSFNDRGYGVAVDGSGNALITGSTEGILGAPPDAFLAQYDASGGLLWTSQMGTSFNDRGYGVAVDGSGNAYITGYTEGLLGGGNAGGPDVFLAKYKTCYADCDGNTTLDILDFLCFQDAFVKMDPYANCDGNTVFDIFDFLCFQDAFVTGCP